MTPPVQQDSSPLNGWRTWLEDWFDYRLRPAGPGPRNAIALPVRNGFPPDLVAETLKHMAAYAAGPPAASRRLLDTSLSSPTHVRRTWRNPARQHRSDRGTPRVRVAGRTIPRTTLRGELRVLLHPSPRSPADRAAARAAEMRKAAYAATNASNTEAAMTRGSSHGVDPSAAATRRGPASMPVTDPAIARRNVSTARLATGADVSLMRIEVLLARQPRRRKRRGFERIVRTLIGACATR